MANETLEQPATPERVGVGSKELLDDAAQLLACAPTPKELTPEYVAWMEKRVLWFTKCASLLAASSNAPGERPPTDGVRTRPEA